MFESLKELAHKILAEIEALEVAAQQVTSVAVDQTGPGADVLNEGEEEKHEGDDPPPAPAAPAAPQSTP